MNLVISLDGNDIKLTLKEGRKIIGEYAWTDEYTLSEQLLPQMDALLKKNKVAREAVAKVTAKVSKTSGVTSARIVRTVAAAWKAGKAAC